MNYEEAITNKLLSNKNVISIRYDEDEIFINTDTSKETIAEHILDSLIDMLDFYGKKQYYHFGMKQMKDLYPDDNLSDALKNHYAIYANVVDLEKGENT